MLPTEWRTQEQMATRRSSDIAKMLSSALKGVHKGERQRTIAWMKQELIDESTIKSTKINSAEISSAIEVCTSTNCGTKGVSKKIATRSRKLLTAEEPEILRPHCDKCGFGDPLRPGLDCRCHCPQCTTGKPRCSSPRMALRRETNETCESSMRHRAKNRSLSNPHSGTRSRRTASSENVGEKQQPQKASRGGSIEKLETLTAAGRKQSSLKTVGKSTTACSRGQSRAGDQRLVEAPIEEPQQKNMCKEPQGTLDKKPSSSSVCKRGRCGSLKLQCHYAAPSGKCENNSATHFALWSDAGRLRQLSMICYCNACMGLTTTTCTSPRMAELKKMNTGRESQTARATKTV